MAKRQLPPALRENAERMKAGKPLKKGSGKKKATKRAKKR
jgi:hypothetical protein